MTGSCKLNEYSRFQYNDGGLSRPRKHRPRRARRQLSPLRNPKGPRTPPAQGPHRREESLLRLRPLQGIQARPARGGFRTHRDPAPAPVGEKFRRHPHGRGRARSLLHEKPCRHLRHHQRRLRFFAAREQAARERQDRHRRRGEKFHVRPLHQQLRRIPVLRRSRACRSAVRADGRPLARRCSRNDRRLWR